MNFRYIISPFAELDLDTIHDWYSLHNETAFKKFDHAFEVELKSILSNPHQFQIIHKTIRRAILKKFPYSIFYRIIDDKVIILSVIHHKRNPKVWKKRTI
jgi:toxin ParE1/3/4